MLKPYVYALIDPRDGSVFYIGKGTGNRMHQHEQAVKRGKIDNAEKARAIFGILAAGFKVVCRVLQVCATDKQAYEAEKQHIAAHQGLTNLTAGGGGVAAGGIGVYTNWANVKAKTLDMIARTKNYIDWANEKPRTNEESDGYHMVVREMAEIVAICNRKLAA